MAPKVVGGGEVGLPLKGLVIVGDGVLVLAKHKPGKAPMVVGVGIVRLELEGLVIVGDGVLVLTKVALGIAPTDVGVGIVGLQAEAEGLIQVSDVQREGLTQVSDGVLVLTKAALGVGLTDVGAGVVRPDISDDRGTRHGNRYDPTPFPESAHHIRCPVSLLRGQRLFAMCSRGWSHQTCEIARNILHIPVGGVNLAGERGSCAQAAVIKHPQGVPPGLGSGGRRSDLCLGAVRGAGRTLCAER